MITETNERGTQTMKKFVVVASIGNHNHGIIECSVKDVELVAESDDRTILNREYAFRPVEYRANGKWYSYKVMNRTEARKLLKQFDKLG